MRTHTLAKIVAAIGFVLGCAIPVVHAAERDALGTWLTADGDSHIRIQPCGAVLCGVVVWLREPLDSAGNPFVDVRNPDPALRNRSLLGMRIFFDLEEIEPGQQWRGRVYNPKDGSTYLAFVTVVSHARLDIKGCVLGGMICSTQAWSRVEEAGGDTINEAGSGSASNDLLR